MVETIKNIGIKTVAGAIEGGLTTFLGGEMLAMKCGQVMVKQTFKNAAKKQNTLEKIGQREKNLYNRKQKKMSRR